MICVGFMAARFKETIIDLCQTINDKKKDAWLVLGGHGPSPIPDYIMEITKADIITIGEAENTIIDLLETKIKNSNLRNIAGIAYRDEKGETIVNQRAVPVEKLDEIPFPLWEAFPMEKYVSSVRVYGQEKGEKSLSIITSRGCVNRCNFCYRLEKGIRTRSIPNIIEEMRILYDKFGVTCYFFQDELFVLNKKRLLDFENALKDSGLKIKFFCNARVDIMDEEMISILKRCGCKFINFGFESSNDKVLKLMKKNATAAQNLKVLKMVKKEGGIGFGLNFIWNNIGDDEATLRENAKLIKKYNTYDQCRTIRPVTPYPGSDLYYEAIRLGKIKGPGDFFDKFKNSDLITINFMEIPDSRAYELLIEINTDLILDHYRHTGQSMQKAKQLITNLRDLYAGKIKNFRGVRHYAMEEE
jgi:radical SAM superfamily enzyme YgiQ (UPF0313 family)